MNSHFDLSDADFKKQFAECNLNPTVFSHEAHLRLAWILLNELGLQQAEDTIQSQLQKFVAHVGEADKYHVTVTFVAMKAVHHFMQRSKTDTFKGFIAENQRLMTHFKELINSHYSFNIFASEEARLTYLEPDLLPFTP